MEDGLLCALTYRHTARLYATYSLLTLALPTHWDDKKTLTDALKGFNKCTYMQNCKRIEPFLFGLQRCVRSTVVRITWKLWLAICLPRSLSSLKVHNNIIIQAIFQIFSSSSHTLPPSHLSPSDVASHLQGHCHWLVEMAVKVVSAITKGTSDTVSFLQLRNLFKIIYLHILDS